MAENFWTSLTHHYIEGLAFALLLILGLELLAKASEVNGASYSGTPS